MKTLWTFNSKEKLDRFIVIMNEHDLIFEIHQKENGKQKIYEIIVNEKEYTKAKQLLLRHRERRTSADLL